MTKEQTDRIIKILESFRDLFSETLKEIKGEVSKTPSKPIEILPKWFTIAQGELGTKEIKGPKHNARVLEYHASTGKKLMTDEIPWCASFVGWCLEQAGFEDSNSAAARSYLKVGQKCDLKRGAIVVFWRESPRSWKGHVGFVDRWDDEYIYTLGGNQSNSVSIAKYPRNKVLGYRWPLATQE